MLSFQRPAAARLRGARAVGVHQPRDGLRAAARGRARPRLRATPPAPTSAMTVAFTIALVVFAGQGARGLLLGNFGASALVVLGPVVGAAPALLAARAGGRTCERCSLRAADRAGRRERLRAAGRRPLLPVPRPTRTAPPGCTRSRSSSRRWCSWRCAASSTRGRRWPTRSRATSRPRGCTRSSRPTTRWPRGWSCAAVALLGRWMVRLLAAPRFFDAYRALPWLALGWALYGLYLVFVAIAGRARVTSRNFPAGRGRPGGQRGAAGAARPARRRRAGHRRRRASRCAAPTRRCSPSCTCSRAACSGSASNGGAWPS